MEEMDIFLLDPATTEFFHIPVNPAVFQVRGEALLETVEIARLGEVDWPAGNRRTEITWESFLPQLYDPGYCRYNPPPEPFAARTRLTNWRVSATPLRLVLTGTQAGRRRDLINAPVLIVTFNSELRGGEPGDIYYEISCRQQREVAIRTSAEAGVTAAAARVDPVPVPGRYTVQPGDTLWLIAKRQLGYGERWQDIYLANLDAIGPDPNVVKPGTVLQLPGAGRPPTGARPAPPKQETQRSKILRLKEEILGR